MKDSTADIVGAPVYQQKM